MTILRKRLNRIEMENQVLRGTLQRYSNMLDGREDRPHSDRTEITYGELWKARDALNYLDQTRLSRGEQR
jgi:hypothetical protein